MGMFMGKNAIHQYRNIFLHPWQIYCHSKAFPRDGYFGFVLFWDPRHGMGSGDRGLNKALEL